MPLLGVLDGDDAEVQEDDAVHEGGQRLDAVLHGGVGLLGDVGEGVALLHEPAPDEADDARPVDALGQDEGVVRRREDDQRLNDPGWQFNRHFGIFERFFGNFVIFCVFLSDYYGALLNVNTCTMELPP